MNQEKIGNYIKKLREEKHMNQQQLADKLHISRQAVSKWELGKSIPDPFMTEALSKIFGVPVADIITGEKTNIKKHVGYKKVIVILIIIFLISFFFFFINSFKSIKVYTLTAKSNIISINNGIIVDTNEKIYFQIGEIKNALETDIDKISLYYTKDDQEIEIYSCNNCKISQINFVDHKPFNEYIDYNNIEYVLNSLFIKITFKDDDTEIIKINTKRDFYSNIFFNKYSKKVENIDKSNNEYIFDDSDIEVNIKRYFKKYDDGYIFKYKTKNEEINAKYMDRELFIDIKRKKIREYWSINYVTNIMNYEQYENDEKKIQETFNIEDDLKDTPYYNNYINILTYIFSRATDSN